MNRVQRTAIAALILLVTACASQHPLEKRVNEKNYRQVTLQMNLNQTVPSHCVLGGEKVTITFIQPLITAHRSRFLMIS